MTSPDNTEHTAGRVSPETNITPEQAKDITRLKQQEADEVRTWVDQIVASVRSIRKENNFAPKMAAAYERSK